MSVIKEHLRSWIYELCERNAECEAKLRDLLRGDKELIRNVNSAFVQGDVKKVKVLIEKYKREKGIMIFTCVNCSEKNVIYSSKLPNVRCNHCNKMVVQTNTGKLEDNNVVTGKDKKRRCLYCSNPVSSIPGSTTCYSHRNVGFNVYG